MMSFHVFVVAIDTCTPMYPPTSTPHLLPQDDEPGNEVPEFEGDTSQSQRTPSPAPSGQEADIQPKENGKWLSGLA